MALSLGSSLNYIKIKFPQVKSHLLSFLWELVTTFHRAWAGVQQLKIFSVTNIKNWKSSSLKLSLPIHKIWTFGKRQLKALNTENFKNGKISTKTLELQWPNHLSIIFLSVSMVKWDTLSICIEPNLVWEILLYTELWVCSRVSQRRKIWINF